MDKRLYVDEPCVVSFFVGELGWLVQRWQARLRWMKHNEHQDRKFLIMMNRQFHPIVDDFVSYTIDLPEEFYTMKLETDCYEAPISGSPPGSLTPPNVYAALIEYFRNYYNVDKAIEIWTPRGYDITADRSPQVFTSYKSTNNEDRTPLFVVFPRGRTRASNRNVPEYVWRRVVDILSEKFTVVLSGTPDGSFLGDYEGENVINLINYSEPDKMGKTMHYLHHATCSLSSQSGPTHVSLLCLTPTYIIGHEKTRHTVTDNRFNTPVSFRYVQDYRAIDAETIINDLNNFIDILGKNNIIGADLNRKAKNYINRPSLRTLENRSDLVGAEIGVWRGGNAENILQNLDIKKLYLIDPYRSHSGQERVPGTLNDDELVSAKKIARSRLEKYEDKIVWIEDLSENAISEISDELDFVYIDGSHKYEYAKKDIETYYPIVKPGGMIGGHDYDEPTEDSNGVIQAVAETLGSWGIEVKSDVCADDSRTNDWWAMKPTSFDNILDEDMETMSKLCSA